MRESGTRLTQESVLARGLSALLIFCGFFLMMAVTAAGNPLSAEESAFLQAHPLIRLGADANWPPFDMIGADGRHTGVNADYVSLLEKKLGIRIQVVIGQWKDIQEQCRMGQLDGLLGPSINQERRSWLIFTRSYLASPHVILTRANDDRIHELTDLNGRHVAHNQGDGIVEKLREQASAARLFPFPSCADALIAVSTGQADAAILTIAQAGHDIEQQLITNLKVQKTLGIIDDSRLHFAVRKELPLVRDILQKGFDQISEEEHRTIRRQWIPLMAKSEIPPGFLLSPEDKEWLKKHREIRLGADPQWAPVEFLDSDGQHRGVAAEYLRNLSDTLGVRFIPGKPRPWNEVYAEAGRGEVDVVSAVIAAPEREQFLSFTQPYLKTAIVIVARSGVGFSNLEDLRGRKVGLMKGYIIQNLIQRDFPEVILHPFADQEEALKALAMGEIDGFVDAISVVTCALHRLDLDGVLAITGVTPYSYDICMGVRKDWPELRAIIDRYLASVPLSEKRTIERLCLEQASQAEASKWKRTWRTASRFMAIAGVVLVIILFWNRRLSREILMRTIIEAELKREKEKSEAASRAKSDFVARVSHDLRTPMNAMLGFSEILGMGAPDPKQRQAIDAIQDAGKLMVALLNDLLDIARIEEGRLELSPTIVDLRSMTQNIRLLFLPQAAEKGITLSIAIPDEVPECVVIDEIRLRQVLSNLLSNAVKFTDQGGVELIVAAHHEGDTTTLEFRVRDTGVGIPPENLETIFEPFRQQRGQDRSRYGGTGLGLSISRQLAILMKGRLEVKSEPGRGSEFMLILPQVPLSKAPPLAKDKGVEPLPQSLPHACILVVDDVPVNRRMIRERLQAYPFSFMEAGDGQEALACASHRRPDLVLLDVDMPIMDGMETVRRMKSDQALADIPIVLVTATTGCESDPRVTGNVAAILRKPVNGADLIRVLTTILGNLAHLPTPEKYLPGEGSEENVLGIMVVDDDDVVRSVLAEFLHLFGARVIEASTGEQALDLMRNHPPAMVILDLNMPGMGGKATREAMAQDPQLASIPVLFLTGDSWPEALTPGDSVLCKPISMAELSEALQKTLGDRMKERASRSIGTH